MAVTTAAPPTIPPTMAAVCDDTLCCVPEVTLVLGEVSRPDPDVIGDASDA